MSQVSEVPPVPPMRNDGIAVSPAVAEAQKRPALDQERLALGQEKRLALDQEKRLGPEQQQNLSWQQQGKIVEKTPESYKAFVAGIFSGIAKLSVGHPFDTIKVRLQTTDPKHFRGPLDCVLQTFRKEGVRGFYKGATPPLVGWMFMDSLTLGSLTIYRRLVSDHVFAPRVMGVPDPFYKLSSFGHGIAGIAAGWTVSTIAAPVEHVKARLQIQYAATKSQRLYSGPLDCVTKITRQHGIVGLYRGFAATVLFRTFFFAWWGTYDLFTRMFQKHSSLSAPAINFWAGGLSAQCFWMASYPSDVVKQRIMTDGFGKDRKFNRWIDAARDVYAKGGAKGYWRGFMPCFLRAFPANACALVAFEGVMRAMD